MYIQLSISILHSCLPLYWTHQQTSHISQPLQCLHIFGLLTVFFHMCCLSTWHYWATETTENTELLRLLRAAGQKSLASNIRIVQNIWSKSEGWGELKNKTASAPNLMSVQLSTIYANKQKKIWGYTPLPLEFQCLSKHVIWLVRAERNVIL